MFSVVTKNVVGNLSYFVRDSAVLGDSIGTWLGRGASFLFGAGERVDNLHFAQLLENINPHTGKQLSKRQRDDRRTGMHIVFDADKTYSILTVVARQHAGIIAYRYASELTLLEMQKNVTCRVRKAGQNTERLTNNLLAASYLHFDSRPQNGITAPHVHQHFFTMNETFDEIEASWKAVDFASIKRRAPYFDAFFKAHLTRRLAELGYPVGDDLRKRIPERLISLFSERTKEINRVIEEKKITDPSERAKQGALTREPKGDPVSLTEFGEKCRSHATPEELRELDSILPNPGRIATFIPNYMLVRCLDQVLQHNFERASVVTEDRLVIDLLSRNPGKVLPQEAIDAVRSHPELIHREEDGIKYCTTKAALSEERELIDLAKSGRGKYRPLNIYRDGTENAYLTQSQQQSVRHALRSTDSVIPILGDAGTGKTTVIGEIVDGIRARDTHVFLYGPTAEASRGTLREAGHKNADTISRFLVDESLQRRARNSVVIIDEAGAVGTPTMTKLIKIGKKQNIRFILVGDTKQHNSVERGDALRILLRYAGLTTATVRENRRQTGAYKIAVDQIAEQKIELGFSTLDKAGVIKEMPVEQGHREIAQQYLKSLATKEKLGIVSPTHDECRSLTATIRETIREHKYLKRSKVFKQLVSLQWTTSERQEAHRYRRGQVIQFHQNVRGFRAGERVRVLGKDPFGNISVVGGGKLRSLPLRKAKHFDVFERRKIEISKGDKIRITKNGRTKDGKREIRNGAVHTVRGFLPNGDIRIGFTKAISKTFGHLEYGYVMTSHASQSKAFDRVICANSSASFPATNAKQFYVSISRGERGVHIYTDDKKGLLEAVTRSADRKSALELTKPSALTHSTPARVVRQSIARTQQLARAAKAITAKPEREVEREP